MEWQDISEPDGSDNSPSRKNKKKSGSKGGGKGGGGGGGGGSCAITLDLFQVLIILLAAVALFFVIKTVCRMVRRQLNGIIQKTDSSIILKDDDGNDIKLTLLKTPISLDSLECEHEGKKNSKTVKRLQRDFKDIAKKRTLRNGGAAKEKLRTCNVTKKTASRTNTFAVKTLTKAKILPKIQIKDLNLSKLTLLEEPISLDNIEWEKDLEFNSTITFKVKTSQVVKVPSGPPRVKVNPVEFQTWKQNALTIFENSYVYPFIHASNKYKCFVCAKSFLDARYLKEHTIDHNINDLRKELTNRVRDKNLKVDVSSIQCKICSEVPPNIQSLKVHLKEHGKEIDPDFPDNIIPFKLEGETFDCQVCGDSFLKLRLLIIHMSKHFNNYSCEICGSVFISFNLLKRHLQTHESGAFPCDKCDKVFSNSSKRSLHMRGVHLKQFRRRCPICPERFNSEYQRAKHLRIVHNQSTGLYRCETCGREYDIKYHLLLHIRSVHLQERNQECPICHARFFSKYCLSRHMVIHTGEKNFKCDICGKAYARRKNLKEHSRSHDVGQVSCTICGRNCSDQATLVEHVNSDHGILMT